MLKTQTSNKSGLLLVAVKCFETIPSAAHAKNAYALLTSAITSTIKIQKFRKFDIEI